MWERWRTESESEEKKTPQIFIPLIFVVYKIPRGPKLVERQILSFELQLCRKTAKKGKREAYFEFLVERQILSYELQLCRKIVKEEA